MRRSHYPNVYWDRSSKGSAGGRKTKYHACWRAEVMVNGKRHKLGRFADEATAGAVAAAFKHQRLKAGPAPAPQLSEVALYDLYVAKSVGCSDHLFFVAKAAEARAKLI